MEDKNNSESLTINKLISVLTITDKDNNTLQNDQKNFEYYKTQRKFASLLLTIASNKENSYPKDISLNAAIQLKNFIDVNWKFGKDKLTNRIFCVDDKDIIIIGTEDKYFIRNNILDAIINSVEKEDIKLLKQFNQILKKILKFDFKNKWNTPFIEYIKKCFESKNQKIIYGGILLLHQLSKVFEYEDKETMKTYNQVLIELNHYLLFFINDCKSFNNSVQALVLYKIFKIFYKNFLGAIPEFLLLDENFEKWSENLVIILKTPIPQQYISDKKNIFWKVKKICFQIITKITSKFGNLIGKMRNNLTNLLEEKYIQIYYDL